MPRSTFHYFDLHLTIPIAVLNAPMVLVETTNAQPVAQLTPWVRVLRHEYDKDSPDWRKNRIWAIDVVHEDFFKTYIQQHVKPFAKEFARLVLEHGEELATCEGFATGMGKMSLTLIEDRLKPRSLTHKSKRYMNIAGRALLLPYWLWKNK